MQKLTNLHAPLPRFPSGASGQQSELWGVGNRALVFLARLLWDCVYDDTESGIYLTRRVSDVRKYIRSGKEGNACGAVRYDGGMKRSYPTMVNTMRSIGC